MVSTLEWVTAGSILAAWLAAGWIGLCGVRRLPRLTVQAGGTSPSLSVIVPARNEAATLSRSVPSLLRQGYPDLEVIVLDDRSTDESGAVLESLRAEHPSLSLLHIGALPEGWLGKPHALFLGSRRARGDWLLFTDADVVFHPHCLEAAVAYAETHRLDHLVAVPRLVTLGFWEPILVGCFGLLFGLALRPWQAGDPRSRASIGIGAFNLIRRSAYEAIGTHRAFANAVVDDLELGRLVKKQGFRQAAVRGEDFLEVRWQVGLAGVVRGVEKNAFAGLGYSAGRALAACVGLVAWGILPFLAAPVGAAKALWAASAVLAIGCQAALARLTRLPVWSAAFFPLGIGVLVYAIARSTLLTLRYGGIEWRGTFYSLAALRRPPRASDSPPDLPAGD